MRQLLWTLLRKTIHTTSILCATVLISNSTFVLADDIADTSNVEPPSNLSAQIYSSRSFELFWDRMQDEPFEYEIYIDGVSVNVTNGISAYFNDQSPGATYSIDVITINSEGERSTPANIVLYLQQDSTSADSNTQDTSNVEPPSNLSAQIYSTRSFEVFWDRVQEEPLRYEIYIDGVSVNVTDGVSSYFANRPHEETYSIDVVAINSAGERSPPANIILELQHDNSSTDGNAEDTSNVEPPSNLSGQIYSNRSFEVFWDRVQEEPLEYEIYIDGVSVNVTDGVSAYFANRTRGETYSIDVVAINSAGERSTPANIVLELQHDSNSTDSNTDEFRYVAR